MTLGDSLCDLRARAKARVRATAKSTSRGALFHIDPGIAIVNKAPPLHAI